MLDKINAIQAKIYRDGHLNYSDKAEWKYLTLQIGISGFVLRSKTIKDGFGRRISTIWSAVPIEEVSKRSRHFSAEWKNIDMTPNDGKPTCKGNCTTRAMSFCLQGIFTYREIEHEQYRLAAEKNAENGSYWGDGRRKVHRNTTGTWDMIMKDLGYKWVRLGRKVRRDNLAVALQGMAYPIITLSSGHVAVVDRGAVVDSWDSRHGRCDMVMVKAEDIDKVVEILRENGISARII
jgi:hypothetical protein